MKTPNPILKNFKYIAHSGLKETEIDADSITLICEDGSKFELIGRRSDGEVSLSADGQLIVEPRASNVIRLSLK